MHSECDRHQMTLSAWIDEESDIDSTRAMFLHLAECENCRKFWRTSAGIEKQLLKEGRISGSAIVDARVASIGEVRQRVEAPPNALIQDRIGSRWTDTGSRESSGRTSFPYLIAAVLSVLAVFVGFFLGWARTWPDISADGREPQVIYVSVLPNVTVLGNIPQHAPKAH